MSLKKLVLVSPLAKVTDSFHDYLVNDLRSISVDQDDPLVDNIALLLELNLDRLQHLHATNDIVEAGFGRLPIAELIHEYQRFQVPLDFSCHIQTSYNEIGPDL